MDTNKLKKSIRISALVLLFSIGALIRVTQKSYIRPVDVVALLGIGATMGAFLTQLFMALKAKKEVE